MSSIDHIDSEILKLLQRDATTPLAMIADKLNLSTTPCWKRIKRLEKEGYIEKKVALLNPKRLDLPISVFMSISIVNHSSRSTDELNKAVKFFPEIMEVYRMSGEVDYLLRIQVKDIYAFDSIYKELIKKISQVKVTKVSSSFALETIKYTTELPI